MKLRSLLFVPGDSEKKIARASQSAADVLILDLEDSVGPTHKSAARDLVAAFICRNADRGRHLFVRINALDTGLALEDLAAVVRPGLNGILVPKSNGAHDIAQVGYYLDAFETMAGLSAESVKVAVVATETPEAMFTLGSYAPAHSRLAAMTWGAEDLGAAIGTTSNKDADGDWSFPFRVARAQCLFAAAAAQVAPIDTLYADFRDTAGLAADCQRARRDGFMGRIAIHPDQVATINECFSPTGGDVNHARRVIAAFEANPGTGVVSLDGRMYDIPHLKVARRTMAAIE